MKIQNLFTSGKMNKDLDERLLPQGEYRDALNVKVANSVGSDVGAIENALSNEVLTSLNFGTNPSCIGAVADDKNKKIYWFVKSDTGSYIAEYSEFSDTSAFVLQDTRAAGSNVLNFKKDKIITGVNVLINDTDQKVFIYWTDNDNPPRYVEVTEGKLYGSNNFTETDISVIKAPPRAEPSIVLQIDGTLDDNYIEDKFFTFAYRYKYKHNKFSALSPFSEVAFFPNDDTFKAEPYGAYAMTNKFNSVQVTYNSGPSQVLEIEVYAKEENTANNFLIGKFNKSDDTLSDNTNYQLSFNNNKIYTLLSDTQYNRVYDNVPLKAAAQDFLGNRIVYGNYEENYDIVDPLDITLNIQSSDLTSECSSNLLYTVTNTTSSNITFSYLLCSESNSRQAIAKPGANRICAASVQSQTGLTISSGNTCGGDFSPKKTLKSNRNYIVGLVYFDSNGRKSTVIADENKFVNVPFESSDQTNSLKVTINNPAPIWADRYKIAVKEVKRTYVVLKTTLEKYGVGSSTLYVRIDKNENNKVPDGANIIAKSTYAGGSLTTINNSETYEVEGVDSYAVGEVPYTDYSTQPASQPGDSVAGVYMKLKGKGALQALAFAAPAVTGYTVFEVISETEQDSSFHEVPGTYNVVNGFHSGTLQNQDISIPAIVESQAFNAFAFGYGVESNRIKDNITLNTFNLGVRLNEVVELYKKNKRIASLTYSDVYEESTSYNGLNVFNLAQINYKDIDEKYGEIKKIHSRDNDLIVFQQNKIHRILFNKNVLFTAAGTGDVSQSLNILGQEVPYIGEYGISNSPESFQSWGSRMYFSDERRSAILRLSQDGITEISEFGMRSWFNDNLNPNLNVRGVGGYDPYLDQYVVSVQDLLVEWRADTFECESGTTTTTSTTTTTTTAAPTTTTTTAAPGTTTTTTLATPFARIDGATSAAVGATITLTGEDLNFTGSTWAWTGNAAAGLTSKVINISESTSGSKTYGVTIDGTYTDSHTVNWSLTTTTSTTSTTTSTTTTTTTTTTTAAPSNCYGVSLGYSSSTTCQQDTSGVYYLDDPDLCSATSISTDTFCTTNAPSGYYTYANGTKSRYWNGSSFSQGPCQTC